MGGEGEVDSETDCHSYHLFDIHLCSELEEQEEESRKNKEKVLRTIHLEVNTAVQISGQLDGYLMPHTYEGIVTRAQYRQRQETAGTHPDKENCFTGADTFTSPTSNSSR